MSEHIDKLRATLEELQDEFEELCEADVPADDPYLRIRAEREIFGNTQVRRAGVLVAGSVSRPTIEAYTTPVTTEERALTLLVTGSDFDYERGIGAVDFGTYIAPRVYASYGIGLFDNENVIGILYADTTDPASWYNRDELRTFTALANLIGVKITQARLAEAEEERRRLRKRWLADRRRRRQEREPDPDADQERHLHESREVVRVDESSA